MPTSFIPSTDAGLLAWGLNYSTLISANPISYGLTAPIATTLAAKQSAYAAALTASTDPSTRGGATVFAKETARKDLVAYCRLLARTIQGTLTVTNAQRYALGLTVRDVLPSPIPPPATAPDIDIVSTTGRTVRIRLHDSTSSTRRGRPPGVAGASVFSHVGPTPPAAISDWRFEGNVTRTTISIVFDPDVANGATVWIAAFWFNAKTQPGPTSTPISTNVPGGLTMGEAA